jgi:hypothetical protein
MAYFQTQNPNLGKFWRVLQWKMLVYILAIWSILQLSGIFCGHFWYNVWSFGIFLPFWYNVHMVIWYIFAVLVCSIEKNLASVLLRGNCSQSYIRKRVCQKKISFLFASTFAKKHISTVFFIHNLSSLLSGKRHNSNINRQHQRRETE